MILRCDFLSCLGKRLVIISWPHAVCAQRGWKLEETRTEISQTPSAPLSLSWTHLGDNCGLALYTLFFPLALRCPQGRHRWRTSRLKTARQNMCWRDALLLTSIMILPLRCVFPSCVLIFFGCFSLWCCWRNRCLKLTVRLTQKQLGVPATTTWNVDSSHLGNVQII